MSKTNPGVLIAPGLWKLKSATYRVRVQKVDPKTGRKLNRVRTLKGVSRAEAFETLEALRAELEAACEDGYEPATSSQVTVGTFAKSWLHTKLERGDLAPSTQNRYAYALDHLSKHLRQMPLGELSPRDVEQWMVAARKKGFMASTINSWLRVLRAALADAVRDRLVPYNVASQVRALAEDVNLEETNSLSNTELSALMRAMSQQHHVTFVAAWTQALTGLRWGEVTALKWEDLDEARGVLLIRRAVCERKLRPLTKTRRARIVGVPQMLAELLKGHRAQMVREQHPGLGSGLMFPSKAGTPLANSRVNTALQAACKAAGIRRRFTSHGFRRTLTDLLRTAHVDPVIASGLTGHETERMRRHYSNVSVAEAVEASERVARLLEPFPESPQESGQESGTPRA